MLETAPLTVLQQAMDSFELRLGGPVLAKNADDLVNRFRRFRGMLGDLHRNRAIADRRAGLA